MTTYIVRFRVPDMDTGWSDAFEEIVELEPQMYEDTYGESPSDQDLRNRARIIMDSAPAFDHLRTEQIERADCLTIEEKE